MSSGVVWIGAFSCKYIYNWPHRLLSLVLIDRLSFVAVVQINLKNPSFAPGKKNFERVLKCLSEFVELQMDFLIAWEPPGK